MIEVVNESAELEDLEGKVKNSNDVEEEEKKEVKEIVVVDKKAGAPSFLLVDDFCRLVDGEIS